MKKQKLESGAASISIELSGGVITMKHGTGKDNLYSVKVVDGTWNKMFIAIAKILTDNRALSQPIPEKDDIVSQCRLKSKNATVYEDQHCNLLVVVDGEDHATPIELVPNSFYEGISDSDVSDMWNTYKYDVSDTEF